MEGSPRKIQFTVPLLVSHLDPEAAEQIRKRRPTPASLVASSDQSSPEIDEDRLPQQLYKELRRAVSDVSERNLPSYTVLGKPIHTPQQALLNSPRQRRRGVKGTPTMKELQFLVEHHQQLSESASKESSESCLSDVDIDEDTAEHLGSFKSIDTAQEFEKLCCQMEAFSKESSSDAEDIEDNYSQDKSDPHKSTHDTGSSTPAAYQKKEIKHC